MRALILLSVVAAAFASQQCGENSHFESCGTACPLTCDNYDNPPKICVLRCDIGCQCDEGYVRSADGRCVRPAQCPQRGLSFECGENSHFESCGTACPLTCDNYDNPPKICVLRCDIGCQCDEGYVKSADGRCVRPTECPQRSSNDVCGENQRYSDCASPCPLTCDNYDNPPIACPAMCIFGCECKKGYVKTRDGRCVRPEECPNRSPDTAANCMDPADTGLCRAYIPQWHYNAQTGKCDKFIYGGCGGNGNRYPTEEKCLENCQGVIVMNATSEVCSLPAETGLCRGYFPMYHFNKDSNQCERFIYGGCGGNENKFATVEECQKACASAAPSACQEGKVVGPCRGHFVRYYHNKENGQCEEFVYGGCLGNSNNFHSEEECKAVCS